MRDEILTGLAGIVCAGLVGVTAYASAKAEQELKDHKYRKLYDIDKQIAKASVDNRRLESAEMKYEAKKTLNYFKAQAENATSIAVFDKRFERLSTMIREFQTSHGSVSVLEAKDLMADEIEEARRLEDAKIRREMIQAQNRNTEVLAKALSEK